MEGCSQSSVFGSYFMLLLSSVMTLLTPRRVVLLCWASDASIHRGISSMITHRRYSSYVRPMTTVQLEKVFASCALEVKSSVTFQNGEFESQKLGQEYA